MTSGGARARSGPPADPGSARSERRGDGWTTLPARTLGKAPAWPLGLSSSQEEDLWKALWKKPQATMWKRLGLTWQVAHYCRSFLEATERGAPASLKTSVLRQEDTLGLSTVGLAALRWRISEDAVAAKRRSAAAAARAAASELAPMPERRLRAVANE